MAMIDQKVVLASTSPRRRELINLVFSQVECIGSNCDETTNAHMTPQQVCTTLAKRKAWTVFKGEKQPCLTLGCDTVVDLNGKVLGKPKDEKEAFCMLQRLQGNTHKVHTGVCLINANGEERVFCETSMVTFDPMSEDEMRRIIVQDQVLDKAGAYAIQGISSTKVKKIEGEYYNVVGLPVGAICRAMKNWNE